MIYSLGVENIALIDQLNIEFSEGLNVLTGETGAGKSIIVDSMNLVLGERADREMIRHGKEKAHVEALLYVDMEALLPVFEEYGIEPQEEIVISRNISVSGKNMCRINGAIVNLATLKGFMDHVVDLVGQHEHQSLLYSANHLALIDNYGHDEIAGSLDKVQNWLQQLKDKDKELAELGGNEAARKQQIDLLEFQIEELDKADIQAGELEKLTGERELLQNAQSILEKLGLAYHVLYEGDETGLSVLGALKTCVDSVASIAHLSADYENLAKTLEESYYSMEESAHDISRCVDGVVFDEQRQDEVEERIEFLHSLMRKYQMQDEDGLLAVLDAARQELDRLVHSDELHAQLAGEIAQVKTQLYQDCVALSDIRKKVVRKLSKLVENELKDLGMQGAVFEARFAELPPIEQAVFQKNGLDEVEFYISTNAGEPLKPLSKTASGGEISRIMLAFKNIVAATDHISTMIFDEIDTGISGRMAHVVAEKMCSIAKSRQVICVTHLAQIAAMGDRSFLITKQSGKNVTNTNIKQLSEAEIPQEIARLSGGLDTENALGYAKELLANAKKIKQSV